MIPIEIRRLQDILTSFLGQPKNDLTDNYQLQYSCPRCIENKGEDERNKHNLEINLAKGVFKCWSCASEGDDMQGSIKKLIKKYGNPTILREYTEAIKDIMESHLYELQDFKNNFNDSQIERLYLPKTYTPVGNLDTCPNWRLKNYLQKRHITQEIIDRYHIGYTTWEEAEWPLRNRVIIPSYDSFGELNYWVGRTYTESKPKTEEKLDELDILSGVTAKKTFEVSKYKNCKADKDRIIFQESLLNFDAPIILVEGAIDCLYYPNALSMLGKVMGKESETYRKLAQKANSKIYICLDSDTRIEETKRIYNMLDKIPRLKGKIYYVRLGESELPYKDFGEIYEAEGKSGIIKAFRYAKQFSEVELIF